LRFFARRALTWRIVHRSYWYGRDMDIASFSLDVDMRSCTRTARSERYSRHTAYAFVASFCLWAYGEQRTLAGRFCTVLARMLLFALRATTCSAFPRLVTPPFFNISAAYLFGNAFTAPSRLPSFSSLPCHLQPSSRETLGKVCGGTTCTRLARVVRGQAYSPGVGPLGVELRFGGHQLWTTAVR